MPEPIIRFPSEVIGTAHHVQIHSFSGGLLVEPNQILSVISFTFLANRCFICPPLRIGHSTWRAIPQLNDGNIEIILGDALRNIPLQAAVFQGIPTDEGATLHTRASRGNEYDPSLPPDTFVLVAPGSALQSVLEQISNKFVPKLLDWIRVLSNQWWVGQPTERQTGSIHFEFEINANGQLGPHFSPRARQATAPTNLKLVGQEMWLSAVSAAAKGQSPKLVETMRCDISASYHNGDHRMAIILSSCWMELLRDAVLDRTTKRLVELKTSQTDLLKQVSVGFQNIYDRNLSVENPKVYAFVRACWIARGHLAHGRDALWSLDGTKQFGDYPAADFHQNLDSVSEWFENIGR